MTTRLHKYIVRWSDPERGATGEQECPSAELAIALAQERSFDAGPAGFAFALHGKQIIATFEGGQQMAPELVKVLGCYVQD